MRRLHCFSRKVASAEPAPVPSRPVYKLPMRMQPREELIKSTFQHHILQVNQQDRQIPFEPPPNEMNVGQGADGGNVPPQKYIEISDGEEGEDFLDLRGSPAPVQQQLKLQPAHAPVPDGNVPAQAAAAPSPAAQARAIADFGVVMIEDDDMDVNDPVLAQFMMEAFNREHEAEAARSALQLPQPINQLPPDQQYEQEPQPMIDPRLHNIDQVILVFPDICRDYVSELYTTVAQTSDCLIAHILDKVDQGTQYPKAKETQNKLKRKRELDEDEEAAKKYGSAERVIPEGFASLRPYIRDLMAREFTETPMNFIDIALKQCGYRLFSTYRVLEEAHRTFSKDRFRPPYNKIKYPRKNDGTYNDANLQETIQRMSLNLAAMEQVEVLKELQAARRIRKKADAKRQAELQAMIEEENNLKKAMAEGTMTECGCCFGDFPLNRMIHCDNEVLHFFCRACAKQTADTEVGNSKYELHCMSMDGCAGGFSLDQRKIFLDEPTIIALERNEQEAVLRMAGIENLASCPFCPYAAEYLPIDIDREFRCEAPDCERTSCRLCKLESHIPKSCEEHKKDLGLSVRRQIEEAMSAALIRKCNKCGTPFVKEEGCNKMTCTRNGCFNIQCYICSKSCQYDHFDDARRGGKSGNCPLFENVEDRHENDVKKAEQEALDKVRAENPEYTEEDLKVKMSEVVKKDDERRKSNPRNFAGVARGPGGMMIGGQERIVRIERFQVQADALGNPMPRPAYYGLVPGLPPAAPAPLNLFPAGEGMLVDVNFGDNGNEIFAGMWDDLPLGFQLGHGILQAPPHPYLVPGGQQYDYHPYVAPRPAVNQPMPPGYPGGNAQDHLQVLQPPPGFQNMQPQEYRGNAGAGQGGYQAPHVFPALPRRSPRAAVYPGHLPPPAQPPAGEDGRRRSVDLRANLDNLLQQVHADAGPEQGNMDPQQMVQQPERQRQFPRDRLVRREEPRRPRPVAEEQQLPPELQAGLQLRRPELAAVLFDHDLPRHKPNLNPPNGQA